MSSESNWTAREDTLGIHALVWVGGWSAPESERAIAATAEAGYDFIDGGLKSARGAV